MMYRWEKLSASFAEAGIHAPVRERPHSFSEYINLRGSNGELICVQDMYYGSRWAGWAAWWNDADSYSHTIVGKSKDAAKIVAAVSAHLKLA